MGRGVEWGGKHEFFSSGNQSDDSNKTAGKDIQEKEIGWGRGREKVH